MAELGAGPASGAAGVVLLCHRIAEVESDDLDPYGLSVRPAVFEEQLESVLAVWPIVPLANLVTSEADGPRVVVTFDDGYVDTLSVALPVLERVREGLLPLSVGVGLKVLDELLEEELVALVGPKGRHDTGRTAPSLSASSRSARYKT